jgi:hypothetical protein
MTKRRGSGDGGIDARGKDSWRIRYRVNGRRFTKTVKGTKSAAQKALRNLLHAGDTGAHVAPDKMTLGHWIEHWACDRLSRQAMPGDWSPRQGTICAIASMPCRASLGRSAATAITVD